MNNVLKIGVLLLILTFLLISIAIFTSYNRLALGGTAVCCFASFICIIIGMTEGNI